MLDGAGKFSERKIPLEPALTPPALLPSSPPPLVPHLSSNRMFAIEGLFGLVIGIASFFLLPPGPSQTKAPWRPKGYFTEREVKIIVNKVVRDDPTKTSMNNRQALTPRLLWRALCDWDMYPMYLIGLTFVRRALLSRVVLALEPSLTRFLLVAGHPWIPCVFFAPSCAPALTRTLPAAIKNYFQLSMSASSSSSSTASSSAR